MAPLVILSKNNALSCEGGGASWLGGCVLWEFWRETNRFRSSTADYWSSHIALRTDV